MNGSVYKRCPCGEKARQSCKREHGSWYFAHDVPTLPGDTRRPRVRRGGFANKTDAQEALIASMNRHRQTGMAAEQRLEGRRKFLADYLPEWLSSRTKLKPSTRRSYQRHISLYLVPRLGHLRLEDISITDIEEMYEWIRRPRRRKHDPEEWRVSAATIERIHASLRKALNDAVRRYRYIDHNPAHYVELETVTTPQAKYWTSKQAGRFLDAIVDDPLYALYLLTLHRGPRRGEVLAVRWEDVDLDAGTIDIHRNLVQLGYATVEGTPKSEASQRLITIDKSTVKALKRHRKRQRWQRVALGLELDGEVVFTTEDGKQVHPEYASRHLDVLIRKAGVPRITFHQLRHTAAALMLEAGADLKYVQYVLGHEDMFITARIYAHVTARLDRLRSAQVDGLIPRTRKHSADEPDEDSAAAAA